MKSTKVLQKSPAQPLLGSLPSMAGLWKFVGFVGLVTLTMATPILGIRWLGERQPPKPPPKPVSADLTPARVVALGRIAPAQGVTTIGGPVGEVVERLTVAEGDWVRSGDVVAYLRNYQERLAEVEVARQEVQTAYVNWQTQTQLSMAQIEARQVDLALLPQTQEEAIRAQQAVIGGLLVERNLAKGDMQRDQALQAEGAIARNTVIQRQATLDQVEQRLQQSQATLQQLIATQKRDLANARLQLQTLQSESKRTLARIQQDVRAAEENLSLAEVRLQNSQLRSPQNGRVLRILTKPGENLGEVNRPGKSGVLVIGNTKTMEVLAEVHESNIRWVKPGQSVKVRSRNQAFEGTVEGRVIAIGQEIFKNNVLNDDPSALGDARVIEVKIRLNDNRAIAGLTNLQVDVEIQIPSTQSVSLVSPHSRSSKISSTASRAIATTIPRAIATPEMLRTEA